MSLSAASKDALSDAAKMATIATSPNPIISADAVEAVRRGLRMAFSRPSLPWTPSPRMGAPIAAAIGLATKGDRMAIPTNVAAAPAPMRAPAFEGVPNRPYRRAATPPAVTRRPTTSRRPHDPAVVVSCDSRRACTGATLAARRAGRIEEKTVTTVPTSSATTIVRGSSWVDVLGRSMLNAERSPWSPMAIPIPATIPRTEANSPTANASTITDVSTCRRLAPSVRSRASSRVRWATMIENVLKMMNAPTNSAMNANTSSAVRKNRRASFSAFEFSSATVVLVTASTPLGSASWIRARSSVSDTPESATTSISSTTPSLPKTCWAVGVSNSASVAPPRLSAVPNPAIPTIRNSRDGPWNRILIVWPTESSYFFAVAASTATWSGPVGGVPDRSSRVAFAVWFQFAPKVGGPCPPMASPVFGSTICA